MVEQSQVPIFEEPIFVCPESDELPIGATTIKLEDEYQLGFDMKPNVEYVNRDGYPLHLQILQPVSAVKPKKEWPIIVYIQGSAWRKQDIYFSMPQLTQMCVRGYVIAIVEYRPSDIAPFPAQIQDTKTAIRFMKKHAKEFHVDSSKTILWGDSSGGHTTVMTGITQDREFDTGIYGDQDISIRCMVDWYGPTDIVKMSDFPSALDHSKSDSPEGMLIGGKDVLQNKELAKQTNPMNYLLENIETPPLLIMHGGSDAIVPFNQSCLLYDKMKEMGKCVELIKLTGGNHGFCGFHCKQALDIVEKFIKKHI